MDTGRLAIINKLISPDSWDNTPNTCALTEISAYIMSDIAIALIASPSEGGITNDGETKNIGETAIITAIPNIGYRFIEWDK